MGLFSNIGNASSQGGGVYFLDGTYLVELIELKTQRSRKNDDLVIAEFKIVESDNDKRKAGMKCAYIINMRQDAALGNVKALVAALNGLDPADTETVDAQIDEEVVEMSVSKEQPCAGVQVLLQCTTVPTRAGGEYTKHEFQPYVAAA